MLEKEYRLLASSQPSMRAQEGEALLSLQVGFMEVPVLQRLTCPQGPVPERTRKSHQPVQGRSKMPFLLCHSLSFLA